MTTGQMTTGQIRHVGVEALKHELGVVGMMRFLQMFENRRGNYTEDRHDWQDQMTVEEIYARIQAKREEPE